MFGIFNWISNWAEIIQQTYNVSPVIFGLLYFGGVPVFYLSIYKIVKCIKTGQTEKIIKWGLLLGAVILAPFGYVAIFGKNLPSLFWIVLICFLGLSAVSVVRKIRQKSAK